MGLVGAQVKHLACAIDLLGVTEQQANLTFQKRLAGIWIIDGWNRLRRSKLRSFRACSS
jgi:hypothetical protein